MIGTFILDFQTVDFESDSKIARKVLNEYQLNCKISAEAFAMDDPVERAGWSFAKLFVAGQYAEKLYDLYKNEIASSKGKKFEEKFVAWLSGKMKDAGCGAQIKMAPEMR